jgi:hypothetical protein
MRLAGSPEVFEALSQQFADDGFPRRAASYPEAEAIDGNDGVDQNVEAFYRLYELLQSKGYSQNAAQHLAVEMMEGREPMARTTKRFAGVYGGHAASTGDGDCAH